MRTRSTNINYRHIVLAIALTSLIFILIWGGTHFWGRSYSTYEIDTQEPVSGLVVDAPVEYKGVEVGKVKSIELKNAQWIKILVSIKKGTPITQGTEATLTTKGLTTRGFMGFVYIALNDKGTDLRPLLAQSGQSYPLIPTTSMTRLSLDTTFLRVNGYLKQITELFQSVLDKDTVKALKELLHNMKEVSHTFVVHNQKLGSLITNMEKASHHLEPFLKSGHKTMVVLEKEFKPFLVEMRGIMTRLEHNLDPFLMSTQQFMKMMEIQFLPQTYRTLSNLEEMSHVFLGLTDEIKQDPSILIRGMTPPTPGPGESYAFED